MNDISQDLRNRQALYSFGQSSITSVELSELDARRIDLKVEPPKPVPIISLAGQQICTAGNLTVLAAQVKAGKSSVIGAMLATSLQVNTSMTDICDLLGFTGQPHSGKAVILFDTEQSEHDAWSLVRRAAKRVGENCLPDNIRCYHLANISTPMRRQLLKAELERAEKVCGGIHCVFIDGVADLCVDLNDSAEAFGLVETLVQLASKHNCPIVNVLHENPSGAETGKTRGHLGSQLERKAESNLRVVKNAKGVSLIYSDRCRHAAIPKDDGPRFAWNNKAGMHSAVLTDAKADRADEKRRDAQREVDAAFAGVVGNIIWSDLKKRVMDCLNVSDKTAQRRIKTWCDLRLIVADQKEYRRT